MSILSWIVTILLMLGVFFFIIGSVGILRFPDFYSRLHASGKCDALATTVMLFAVALYVLKDASWQNWGSIQLCVKILLISCFIYVASPAATHAITKAAYLIGLKPWTKEKD